MSLTTFDLDAFIARNVTGRDESLFAAGRKSNFERGMARNA